MKITKDMKVGDIYLNPVAADLWILRKGFPNDYDNEEWVLSLVHTDYEEEYLAVKDFIKLGNIYEIISGWSEERFLEDYKENYNRFWKQIVENEDGTLNKDQVMRELCDYSMVLDNCAQAYSKMTNNMVSKQNTKFSAVEEIFDTCYLDRDITTDDICDMIENNNDINELKSELKKYFGIMESNNENNK